MEQRDLQLFTTLAQTLHFGKAARQCHLSSSALTRAIQRLEREVDQELFLRDRRSVQLTSAGKIFLEYAERSLSDWERCRSQLNNQNAQIRGELSIYSSVTAVYSILSRVLQPFRNRYPDITIKLSTGDVADAHNRVLNKQVDCAIAALPSSLSSGLSFLHLITTPLVCIAPIGAPHVPYFNDEHQIDWERTPVIISDRGELRDTVDGWFRSFAIHPEIFAQVAGNEAIIAMVSLGFGVGIIPELVLQQSPMREQVRIVDTPPFNPYSVGIVYPTKRENDPLISAFREATRDEYV